ncbi:MAG: hypothetical protein AAGG75_15130 [Bacteroidota bacterium]
MGHQDLRAQIDQLLNTLPEEQLKSVLSYLQAVQKTTMKDLNRSKDLSQILDEDAALLKRLAQ